MEMPLDALLYADGGVAKINPSPIGGAWAFVVVIGDEVVAMQSGFVTPLMIDLPNVTNNYTELLATVRALEAAPDGWHGILHTDSHVTECRLVNNKPGFKGIPDRLQERVWQQRHRLGALNVVLLDGHPNIKQLETGIGKRGNPVSKFNKICDEECARLALEFMSTREVVS